MDKKESLKILDKYTHALKAKAEAIEQATGGYTEADWEEAYTSAPKMFSITRNDALGDCDYYNAFAKLEPCIIDSKEDSILIRGLTVKELERLLED